MSFEKYLNLLDTEEIYRTILDLEGPKHPLYNWIQLEEAAKYIKNKMESYGLKVEYQEFFLKGFEKPFKNVIGYLGDSNKPAIILGSHYDTVINTPGANDNLSGVAVSLEVARVLSKLENPPTIIIAAFTLEEGYPTFNKKIFEALRKKGWTDDKDHLKSYKLLKFDRQLTELIRKKRHDTKQEIKIIYETILKENKDNYSNEELEYVQILYENIKKLDKLFNEKKVPLYGLVGSTMFVNKALKENLNIKYIINFDTLGWISEREGTQKPLPISEEMSPLTSCYKMDIKGTKGNFITIAANQNAKNLLDEYVKQCSKVEIDMPCFGLYLPFDINIIYSKAPDTLRSDHAPFWAENIPGIFVTDTANFRSPFYHTGEDTYAHINYEALEKIAKATLETILLL